MEPATGSVFAEWVERRERYAVKQLCGEADGWRWWLDLDWFEPEMPTDVASLQPLRQNRYFFVDELSYRQSDQPIPANWVLIGVREPLRSDPPRSLGPTLGTPAAAYEYEWLQHRQADRDAFKQCIGSTETVEVAGQQVRRGSSHLGPDLMRARDGELAQLVNVLTVEIEAQRPDLAEILAGFPFLREVTISGPLAEITLPQTVTKMTLGSRASADMVVHGGPVTDLLTEDHLLIDLPSVTDLIINRIGELDLGRISTRYRKLGWLSLNGAPGTLTGLDALTQMPELRALYISDLFGFEKLPYLPELKTLDLDSVPKAAGVQARKDYASIEPTVTKLRSETWLADNLDNPFHGWDGSDFVPARYAKSAWTAYKKHRKALRQAATQAAAGEIGAEDFGSLVSDTISTMANEFNGWDKTGWIETVEREHIATTYFGLLKEISETYPVDLGAAMQTLDDTRDW